MSCLCKNLSFSAALALAVIFGLVASGAISEVFAAPPFKKECNQEDVYERLECKQEGIVGQVGYMVDDNLTSRAIGLELSAGKKKFLKSEKTKAQVIKKHVKKDSFENAVKGIRKNSKKSCALVPLEEVAGHINGICEPDFGETCAAEEDLTLECDPKLKRPHPNKPGLVCAQTCETEAAQTDLDEEEELQQVAQEMEKSYDAIEDSMIETNQVLDDVNAILESEAVMLRQSSDDACANIEELPEGLEDSVSYLRGVAEGLAAAHEIAASSTRQTIVAVAVAAGFGGGGGGNSSALGVVTAIAKGVAQMAYVVVDEIVSNKQAEIQKNTFACLQKAVEDITEVGGKVDANAAMIQDEIIATRMALSEQIELLRTELFELLNTPQGRRPDFPEK